MPPNVPLRKAKPLDPKGFYRILKITPEASADEIRLAYAMAKQSAEGPYLQKLHAAYEVLKNPAAREAYDKEGLSQSLDFMRSPLTLVVAVAILAAVLYWMWLPGIRMHGKKFQAGQTLVRTSSGSEFGKVIRVDPSHRFGDSPATTAYLVELAETGKQVWLPAIDLQATCDAR